MTSKTESHRETWGARIRSLRQERGLSLNKLARLAEIEQGNLSRIERGIVNSGEEARTRIAAALNVPVGEIWDYPADRQPADTAAAR